MLCTRPTISWEDADTRITAGTSWMTITTGKGFSMRLRGEPLKTFVDMCRQAKRVPTAVVASIHGLHDASAFRNGDWCNLDIDRTSLYLRFTTVDALHDWFIAASPLPLTVSASLQGDSPVLHLTCDGHTTTLQQLDAARLHGRLASIITDTSLLMAYVDRLEIGCGVELFQEQFSEFTLQLLVGSARLATASLTRHQLAWLLVEIATRFNELRRPSTDHQALTGLTEVL